MAELFTDVPADFTDSTASATNHAARHNATATAANLLKVRTNSSFSRIYNVEMPPYNAVADSYYMDGVATASTATASITGTASTDTITATAHPFSLDSAVTLSGLTGGAGLSGGTTYFVANPTTNTFQLAASAGGSVIDFTTNITAGTATGVATVLSSRTASFTGADVGKTFAAWRAGDSSWQPLHTTIASVASSTSVVLTNGAGRSQTGVRFYISRSGDQTTAIQSAINDASAAGGGIVFLPGAGYLHSGLVMKERVALWGQGKHATYLHLLAGVNVPSIQGDMTSNNSAVMWSVRHLHVDGNRKRQSNLTATVSTTYVAGASTMVLTGVTSPTKWPPVGMISVGASADTGVRYTYFDMVDNGGGTYTLQSVLGDYEYTTDVGAAAGTTVTNFTSPGIHVAQRPASLDIQNPTFADYQEPTVTLDDVWVQNCKGDGVQAFGMSDARWNDLLVTYCEQSGVRPSWDTYLTNINSGNNERYGYVVRGAQAKLLGCQAYYNGLGGIHPHVAGFLFEGPTSLEAGGKMFSVCTQDNKGDGAVFRNSQRPMGDIYADSNGWLDQAGTTYCGVRFVGASNGNVRILSTDRFINGSPTATIQKYGIIVETGATTTQNMNIFLTHKGAGGSAANMLEPVKPGSVLTGGNNITVNSQGGYKVATFAASYTPDPYDAETHEMTLTGNVTINAPANAHLGTRLRFVLVQDATGGRTMTFNAALPATWGPSFAPSARNIIEFVYNGTAWNQLNPDPDGVISKRVLGDVTNSTVTVAALTDLDHTVAANADYTFTYNLMYSSAATTTGLGLQVGVSGSTPVSIAYDVMIMGVANTDAAGVATTGISGDVFYGLGTAIDDQVLSTGVVAAATVYPARVTGTVRTGATGGTLSIKQRSEVAASAITIKRGSHALIQPN